MYYVYNQLTIFKKFTIKYRNKKTTKFVKIRNIDNSFYNNFEYVFINFYTRKQLFNKNKTIVYFKHKIYIVNNFRAKILLKTNILDSQKIVVNINYKSINFLFCEKISIFMNIIVKKRRIFRAIKSAN